MKLMHEDERRKLFEWPVAKRLEIKSACVIGNHYHKNKTEVFVLCDGAATLSRRNVNESEAVYYTRMRLGREYEVGPGVWHSFNMAAGSVLMCLASEQHNPEDDHIVDQD